jgi:hypothetical protein
MTELQPDNNNTPEAEGGTEHPQAQQIATKGTRLKETVRKNLLHADTPEFQKRCTGIFEAIYAKYAWTAQQQGFVLRRNPLKQPPLKDYVFARIVRSEHAFHYIDGNGRTKLWRPDADKIFGTYFVPYEEDDTYQGAILVAERLEFLPGEPEITHDADGCRILNLWRPPPWIADASAPEPKPFLEHLKYLFDNEETAIKHVLNFLGHLVQRPQERTSHALLITSEAKGIGKSTLGTIVRRVVGEQNSRVAQTKDLKSSFDGWLVGKLVVQVDEIYEAGNWDLANKLKPLITERTVSANIKYGPQIEIENFARFIMFSNHTSPLNVEDGDRRYFVFCSKAQPRHDDYYEALHKYIETPEGMNAIYAFLRRHDISTFNPHRRPPMTQAKLEVIEDSVHPLHTYIASAVESGHFRTHLGPEFTWDQLQRQLKHDGYGSQSMNTKEVGQALKLAGVTQTRRSTNGTKQRVFRLPETPDGAGTAQGPMEF